MVNAQGFPQIAASIDSAKRMLYNTSISLSKVGQANAKPNPSSTSGKAAREAKLATIGASLCVLAGLTPGLPKEVRVVLGAASLPVLEASKRSTREYVQEKKLKRLEKVERFERAKYHIQATYRPTEVARVNPLGGELQAIVNVMNIDPRSLQVEGLGVESARTYTRYNLRVEHLDNRADVFGLREKVASALYTTESITFNWIKGALAVDVAKPEHQCSYPTVKEYLGNDRQQIIIPMGLALDRLVTLNVTDGFNGFAVVGEPGSGKTIGVKGIIQFLGCRHHPNVVQYWMAEPQMSKASSFPQEEWANDPHLFAPNSYSYAKTLQVMAKMIYECRRRSKIFEDAGVASLDAYNRIAEHPLPRIFGFVDEPEQYFDKELCDPVYRFPFLRMALVIARMTRSQGGHLFLGPKSMAAGSQTEDSADLFPIPLRRTFGGGICLKVPNITDAEIALQGDAEDEYLLKSVPHLPKNGAAVCRENGSLVRVQMLYADKPTTEMPIVGRGVLPMPDHELPDLLKVLEEFSAPRIAEDDALAEILEQESINYGELVSMMQGKISLDDLRAGKKPRNKPEKGVKPVRDYEAMRRTFDTYRKLRTSINPATNKPMSMSDALATITNGSNPNGQIYRSAELAVAASIETFGVEWVAELNQNLSDEAMMLAVFGRSSNPKTHEKRVATIRECRAKLAKQAAAETN